MKINIKLINSEITNCKEKQKKACDLGATDICSYSDWSACYGSKEDTCYQDYGSCVGQSSDICHIDYCDVASKDS